MAIDLKTVVSIEFSALEADHLLALLEKLLQSTGQTFREAETITHFYRKMLTAFKDCPQLPEKELTHADDNEQAMGQ